MVQYVQWVYLVPSDWEPFVVGYANMGSFGWLCTDFAMFTP